MVLVFSVLFVSSVVPLFDVAALTYMRCLVIVRFVLTFLTSGRTGLGWVVSVWVQMWFWLVLFY